MDGTWVLTREPKLPLPPKTQKLHKRPMTLWMITTEHRLGMALAIQDASGRTHCLQLERKFDRKLLN